MATQDGFYSGSEGKYMASDMPSYYNKLFREGDGDFQYEQQEQQQQQQQQLQLTDQFGSTRVINLKPICIQQEAVSIRPAPITIQQPPVLVKPESVVVNQPPFMVNLEPIVIQQPPLTVDSAAMSVMRPPLLVQPPEVVLNRPSYTLQPQLLLDTRGSTCSTANCSEHYHFRLTKPNDAAFIQQGPSSTIQFQEAIPVRYSQQLQQYPSASLQQQQQQQPLLAQSFQTSVPQAFVQQQQLTAPVMTFSQYSAAQQLPLQQPGSAVEGYGWNYAPSRLRFRSSSQPFHTGQSDTWTAGSLYNAG